MPDVHHLDLDFQIHRVTVRRLPTSSISHSGRVTPKAPRRPLGRVLLRNGKTPPTGPSVYHRRRLEPMIPFSFVLLILIYTVEVLATPSVLGGTCNAFLIYVLELFRHRSRCSLEHPESVVTTERSDRIYFHSQAAALTPPTGETASVPPPVRPMRLFSSLHPSCSRLFSVVSVLMVSHLPVSSSRLTSTRHLHSVHHT